jgi:hypothetical protein
MGSGMAFSISPPENDGRLNASYQKGAAPSVRTSSGLLPLSHAGRRALLHATTARTPGTNYNVCLRELGQAARPISTGKLRALQRFHTRPINLVVCEGPLVPCGRDTLS